MWQYFYDDDGENDGMSQTETLIYNLYMKSNAMLADSFYHEC